MERPEVFDTNHVMVTNPASWKLEPIVVALEMISKQLDRLIELKEDEDG